LQYRWLANPKPFKNACPGVKLRRNCEELAYYLQTFLYEMQVVCSILLTKLQFACNLLMDDRPNNNMASIKHERAFNLTFNIRYPIQGFAR